MTPGVGRRKPRSQRTGGAYGQAGFRFNGHDPALSLLEGLHDVKGVRGHPQSPFLLLPFDLTGIPRSINRRINSGRVMPEGFFAYRTGSRPQWRLRHSMACPRITLRVARPVQAFEWDDDNARNHGGRPASRSGRCLGCGTMPLVRSYEPTRSAQRTPIASHPAPRAHTVPAPLWPPATTGPHRRAA
jgi:hypothetical protein